MLLRTALIRNGVPKNIVRLLRPDVIDGIQLALKQVKASEKKVKAAISDLDLHRLVIPKKSPLPILESLAVSKGWLRSTDLEQALMSRRKDLKNGCYKFIGDEFVPNKYDKLDDFPVTFIPKGRPFVKYEVPYAYVEMFAEAIPFVSTDELRPAMTQVYLDPNPENGKNQKLRVVGTDGHQMFVKPTEFQAKKPLLIPPSAITLLKKAKADTYTFRFYEPKSGANPKLEIPMLVVTFSTATQDFLYITKCVDGEYVHYRSVYDSSDTHTFTSYTFVRKEAIDALQAVSHYTSSTTHQVQLSGLKTALRVFAEDVDFGFEKWIHLKAKVGKQNGFDESKFVLVMPMRLNTDMANTAQPEHWGMNINYLLNSLRALKGDKVTLLREPSTVRAIILLES